MGNITQPALLVGISCGKRRPDSEDLPESSKKQKKTEDGALVPKMSSDIFVDPLHPWGEETDSILATGIISTITIKDRILNGVELGKLEAITVDELQKLILSNIFGTQNFGCVSRVLRNLSQNFKYIQEIDISNNAIGASISLLRPLLSTTTSLAINNCGLSIDDFNAVATVFSVDMLKFLSCSRNYFIGYPSIDHLCGLENITCSSCGIPSGDVNKLLITLSRLPSVRVLNISDNGNGVDDEVIINLITKLSAWSEMEEFSLSDIGLSTKQSRWILNALRSYAFKKLKKIDMSHCRLKKIEDLGDYFLPLPALKILNLSGNNLPKELALQISLKLPNSQVINDDED